MQAPIEYQNRFAHIKEDHRRTYVAMVSFLDDQLRVVTDKMKELGMWNNTLMILSSDNGGYVGGFNGQCNHSFTQGSNSTDYGHGISCFNGEAGANNFPLRGGKYSNFEGGIRVNAFVSGGVIPEAVRGTKLDGMIHIADWYGTLCGLAGVSPYDEWAAESNLPAVDSVDVWPMISGANLTSPRESILVTKDMLVRGPWKYIRGDTNMIEAAWGGPAYPNASTASDPIASHHFKCPEQGCLYNVVEDKTEQEEVSAAHPDVVASMKAELNRQAASIWSTTHQNDPECKKFAWEHYGGFYGPWLEV